MTPSGQLLLTTLREALKAGHFTMHEAVQMLADVTVDGQKPWRLSSDERRMVQQLLENRGVGGVYVGRRVDFVGERDEHRLRIYVSFSVDMPVYGLGLAPTSQNLLPE